MNKNGQIGLQLEESPRCSKDKDSFSDLRARMNRSFLEYASYVIRDRAIPNLADGLKPVQRRILWALHQIDDGKFIKVANVVGHTMQYHPHGDASIGDALVVLTNKRYLIEGQGNFGNVFTGDPPAAARYIECRLTPLAREEIFNGELMEFVPSYDGRGKEPVSLPSNLPLLLMLGTEGIAVGLSSKILSHNFIELLKAQIAVLQKRPFALFPDFATGGVMDASEYDDGRGSVRIRARIRVKNNTTLAITEVPPGTTTESLINSIEDAAKKGKLKVRSINDFTAENIEIEIKSPIGIEANKLIPALYAFTGCETSLSSRITVIRDNRPVEMTVSEVLIQNTKDLVELLRKDLEIQEKKLLESLFFKTLVRIFVENRIYKKIESCKTNEAIYRAIYRGFEPFKDQYYRDLMDEDVETLLGVKIRRISLFDISKHKEEMEKVKAELAKTRRRLKGLTKYAVQHLERLVAKYKDQYRRLTEIGKFGAIEAKAAAFKSFKVSYDRKKGYIGHKAAGEEFEIACSKFDKLLIVFRDGKYRVIELTDKLFVGQDLIYCGISDREKVFTSVYQYKGGAYMKRFIFGGAILNKEYQCIPEKSKILFFEAGTPEKIYIKHKPAPYQRVDQRVANPSELSVKSAKARGNQVSTKEPASVRSKPPRNWNSDAATTVLKFG